MAGFLGGSSGSGTGGEISFPKEFIDPVTKLRVSEPETLIDTDFEYGLQPTKWETVELINNTPSFFSKSGDTTINGIVAMVTTITSREVKVSTAENHGLAVGIPINVTGSKSITADGSYIINSIPDPKTFTYLAKQNQDATASIFDLYTSIITGEFFQGSQIKISDSQGIVTNAGNPSALTVQTDSPHGFQVGTPFYFLNLNSTVSQQFDASNTGAKTFDSSNSATAQSFDGSNTLTSYTIDLNNKALLTGTTSTTQTHSTANKTITVLHSSESFTSKPVGTPLYYNVIASSGYFQTYPRGVVYVDNNGFNVLGASTSTFSVSSTPGGTAIDIPTYPNGTFQLASNASLFAGNNTDTASQTVIPIFENSPATFDGTNTAGSLSTVNTYSGTIIQNNNDAGSTISSGLYVNAMVFYTTTGTAASGLSNNTTYFVTYYNEPAGASVPGFYQIKVAATPGGADLTVSGGTGTQKFRKTGVSVDKDILHVPQHSFATGDLVKYTFPGGGAVTMTNRTSDYLYVSRVYDTYNIELALTNTATATGGTITTFTQNGFAYKSHTFTGTTGSFVVDGSIEVDILLVGGGGAAGKYSGGGGGGEVVHIQGKTIPAGTYALTIGEGGIGQPGGEYGWNANRHGNNTVGFGETAKRGGGGKNADDYDVPASANGTDTSVANGGGGSSRSAGYFGTVGTTTNSVGTGGTTTRYGGFRGGQVSSGGGSGNQGPNYPGGGGGGAGGSTSIADTGGTSSANAVGNGGPGRLIDILGSNLYWGGGGGGTIYYTNGGWGPGAGGIGGGGGGGKGGAGGGSAFNAGVTTDGGGAGGNGGANTGGGGGAGEGQNNSNGGSGGRGIVVVRYKA